MKEIETIIEKVHAIKSTNMIPTHIEMSVEDVLSLLRKLRDLEQFQVGYYDGGDPSVGISPGGGRVIVFSGDEDEDGEMCESVKEFLKANTDASVFTDTDPEWEEFD